MSHVRGITFFALLAVGCTGFDLQPLDMSDGDAAGATGLPDDVAINGGGDAVPKSYIVSTLAGTGDVGATDGPGLSATFSYPVGIAIGPDGSLYVADSGNNKIRKVAADGTVSTYAGTSTSGQTNGSCASATFYYPMGVAVDAAGNVYVADSWNYDIRKIDLECQVTTLAGSGKAGAADGTSTAASFNYPTGLTLDASDNVYVADQQNIKIRKVDPNGAVTTFAGTGTSGYTDGQALNAMFDVPTAIAMDAVGTLYVGDDNYIRKIANGQVDTLAGRGASGLIDGMGTFAAFNSPWGITIDANGNLLVADFDNNAVRQVTPNARSQRLRGACSAPTTAQATQPPSISHRE